MKSVIFMSNDDWWYHNPGSPMRIAKEVSKNTKVLFINSISFGMPLPQQKDFSRRIVRKLKSYLKFHVKVKDNLHVLSPLTIPNFGNSLISAFNKPMFKSQIRFGLIMAGIENSVCIVANPMFQTVGLPHNCSKLLYYVTDKYDAKELPNKATVIEADRRIAERADGIVCVSQALYEHYQERYGKAYLITHGVNYEHFSCVTEGSFDLPEDIRDINKPIIGFMGVIDTKTSDANLLEYVFNKNPEKHFVFIGTLNNEISYLQRYKNAHFLGQKSFQQLPAYLAQFDVALMPFNNSEWIRYCNPIKLKEYLAAGLPVVSINIKEAEPYGDIMYLASNYEEFNKLLNIAIKEDSIQLRRNRQERMSGETWTEKVNQLKDLFV